MAHHLAELMQVAKDAEGRDKELAQEKAVDLILKLWAHRRDLPSNAYPINRIDTVISVIERLRTSTSPFHRNQGSEIEQFLSRIYSGLQTVAINGIVLTSKTTEIPDELKAVEPILDEEERRIVEAVHYWIDLIKTEHTMPQIEMKYVNHPIEPDSKQTEATELNQLDPMTKARMNLQLEIDGLIKTLSDMQVKLDEDNA